MIKFTNREIKAMEYVAKSRNFLAWESIFEKVIADLVDLRNLEGKQSLEVELKARQLAAAVLEEQFLSRLRRLSGKVEPPNDEFS